MMKTGSFVETGGLFVTGGGRFVKMMKGGAFVVGGRLTGGRCSGATRLGSIGMVGDAGGRGEGGRIGAGGSGGGTGGAGGVMGREGSGFAGRAGCAGRFNPLLAMAVAAAIDSTVRIVMVFIVSLFLVPNVRLGKSPPL